MEEDQAILYCRLNNAEYVAASEAFTEVVQLRKFLSGLEVIPGMDMPITLYCDNTVAIANTNDSRHHKRSKQIDRKYYIIRGFMENGDVTVVKIASEDNLADPFTKTLVARSFERHIESMGMRNMSHLLTQGKWEIVRFCALGLDTFDVFTTF